MSRIRTIKPEYQRHLEIYLIEKETGLPLRAAFPGFWMIADREGRFRWQPEVLKLDILPFDTLDFNLVLNALEKIGLIQSYEVSGKKYGYIPNFLKHQIVGRNEVPSCIPGPDGNFNEYTMPPNQTQRYKIYQRDNFICAYCGRNMANDSRAICLDHVIPYVNGGGNNPENLVVSCKKCNALKADRMPHEAGLMWPKTVPEPDNINGPINGPVNVPLTNCHSMPDPEREREREKEREKERNIVPIGTLAQSPKISDSEPKDIPSVISIPLNCKKDGPQIEYAITQSMVDDWETAFPAVDVQQELRNIRQWNLSHPAQRKTKAGILKHITNWLARKQDNGGATRPLGFKNNGYSQGMPARTLNNINAAMEFINEESR